MKKVYLSFLLIASGTFGFCQVTINAADYTASVGESFPYNQTDFVSPGSAGAAQTWDLSSAITAASGSIDHNAANGSFPATNITQADVLGGGEFYYDFSSAGQYIHGVFGSSTLITYSNPMTYLEFPLSMGNSGSDTHAATFDSGGLPFTRAGSTTWNTDGYGTVITPAATFTDVVRVYITQTYTDTYAGGTIDYNVEIYLWIKAGIHYPVASMSTISYDAGTGPVSSSYGTHLASGANLSEINDVSFSIAPNPMTDVVTVFTDEEISEVIISDLSGKEVLVSNHTTISTTELSSGMYLVNVVSADGRVSGSQRVVKY